jgi:hypothetical protein
VREPVRPLLGLGPTDVPNLPASALPGVLAALAAVQAAVAARLATPNATPDAGSLCAPRTTLGPDHWLTPDEAATLASVPRRTVYGWSRRLDWRPFTRRFSRKVLRVEESGLRRWLERQGRR